MIVQRYLGMVLALVVTWQASAADSKISAGQSKFLEERHVEYIVGNLPVIISAPHGGRLAPKSIPNRTRGTLVSDMNTDLLAKAISLALQKKTGRYPHVIICHLKRIKVDCNRKIEDGTSDHPMSKRTWKGFHDFVEEARCTVIKTYEAGLYIDLHGHAHPEAMLELGYLIRNSQLKGNEQEINKLATGSSIRNLASHSKSSFAELLRGEISFGGLMQQNGYPSVPSPAHPHAGSAKYFNGGYNTRRTCMRDDGKISGFQIECPKKGIRDTDTNRKIFAEAFANAVIEYMKTHLKVQMETE